MEYIKNLFRAVKYAVEAKLEWWAAVSWANKFHPAWVEIHNRVQNEYVRQVYHNMILTRYREFMKGGGSNA